MGKCETKGDLNGKEVVTSSRKKPFIITKYPTILYYNKITHCDYTHTDIYIYTQTIQLFFILQNIFSLGLQYNLKINRIKLCFFSAPIKYVHLLQLLSFALLSSSYILYNLSTLTLVLFLWFLCKKSVIETYYTFMQRILNSTTK